MREEIRARLRTEKMGGGLRAGRSSANFLGQFVLEALLAETGCKGRGDDRHEVSVIGKLVGSEVNSAPTISGDKEPSALEKRHSTIRRNSWKAYILANKEETGKPPPTTVLIFKF